MKEEGGKTSTTTSTLSLFRESQAIEEDFIKTYKNLPELWDTDHKHYTNKHKRNAALDVLLQIVKRWNPTANRMNVRQKINIIRSTYRKDMKKYLASKCYGPNGEEIYEHEPKNWKFHALRFLDKDKDNDDNDNDDNVNNDIVEINMDDNNFEEEASNGSASGNGEPSSYTSDVLASISEDEPPRKRHSKGKKSLNKCLKVEMGDEYYADNDELLDRELEAIGANVTCKLKRMNSLQRYHAELLINKVLITGLKNNLTDDTDLTDVYRT